MVDIFGSSRRQGKRGLQGPAGPPGEGLSSFFFSKQLAQWLYENLSFSCFFKDKRSGLVIDKDKIIGIKNQVGDNHAVAINKFKLLIKIPDYGYGVEMNKSLYRIDDLDWAIGLNSKAIFFFAFKIDAWPKTLEYIFHSGNSDRAIYLKGTNLVIQACKRPQHHYMIPYKQNTWNICFIEFNNSESLKSRYMINDLKGDFITEKSQSLERVVYIGGKDNYYFKGVLARFDFYSNFTDEGEVMGDLPDSIKTSVINQLYSLEVNDKERESKRRRKDLTE